MPTTAGEVRHALIFFSAIPGADTSRLPWRRRLAILRRRPRKCYRLFLRWLICWVTGSELNHVAVAYDGAVLSVTKAGDAFFATTAYALTARGLSHLYDVPVSLPIDLDRHYHPEPHPAWPSVLRWWTGGIWPSRDCVAVTCDCLREAGVDVPRRIYQPRQLDAWLSSRGFRRHDVR